MDSTFFSLRHHVIFRIADQAGELDDWLPYAEDLVRKWATQSYDEVKLSGFDLAIASMLLEDDLLPASARIAFARLMLKKSHRLDVLESTQKPGRQKQSKEVRGRILSRVHRLINQDGLSATTAYDLVAKEQFKSPDTIRRQYERATKRRSKYGWKCKRGNRTEISPVSLRNG